MTEFCLKKPVASSVVLAIGVVAMIVASWIFSSAMEAKAYNNLTGKNVSTWDAMWIELRVQANPE